MEASNAAGWISMRPAGCPAQGPAAAAAATAVRIVQQQELEEGGMLRVGWTWSHCGRTHQVELRHSRSSQSATLSSGGAALTRACATAVLQSK